MHLPGRLSLLICIAVLTPFLRPPITKLRAESKPLLLTHVSIIDVQTGRIEPDMTVVIAGEKISALGKAGQISAPANAEMIDGAGKFLIPGLWDMHVHIHDQDFFPI